MSDLLVDKRGQSHSHHVLMQLMQLMRSDDFREGVTSFVQRRAPRFDGR